MSILTCVALLGLVGYAFGFRVGSLWFWRAYTIVYAVSAALKIAIIMWPKLVIFATKPLENVTLAVAMAIILAGFGLLFLALLRHSEWIKTEATIEQQLAEVFS